MTMSLLTKDEAEREIRRAPQPQYGLADMERMAGYVAKAGIFGTRNPDEVMALMLVSQADGLHPVQAMRRYHVIQGRAAMKADAVLAEFQARGGTVEWVRMTNEAVEAIFVGPGSPKGLTISWTIDDARRAKLAEKDNWRNYPRAMLRSRVISEGVRAVMPGVLTGIYTVDEVEDMPPAPPPSMVAEVTVPAVTPTQPPANTPPPVPLAQAQAEIDKPRQPEPSPDELKKLQTLLGKLGIGKKEGEGKKGEDRENAIRNARLHWISLVVEREVSSSKDLTAGEMQRCISTAQADLEEMQYGAPPIT